MLFHIREFLDLDLEETDDQYQGLQLLRELARIGIVSQDALLEVYERATDSVNVEDGTIHEKVGTFFRVLRIHVGYSFFVQHRQYFTSLDFMQDNNIDVADFFAAEKWGVGSYVTPPAERDPPSGGVSHVRELGLDISKHK